VIFVSLKQIVYILFIFLLPLMTLSNNHDKAKVAEKTLAGKITTVTGEELAGVKITVKELNQSFYSDLNGQFSFSLKNDKEYSLIIEGIGFEPKSVKSSEIKLFEDISLKDL